MMLLKKVIFTLLFPLIIIGCSASNNSEKASARKVKIITTTAQVGDLASYIGGERAKVSVLIRGELDPHSYEIVKGDGEKLAGADLIFYNGLGLEHGAGLSSLLKSLPQAASIGDQIAAKHPDKILKKEGVVDPHIWMDISLWKEGIGPIVDALSQKDPEGALYYQERGQALKKEMEVRHLALYKKLQKIPEQKRYLVTSHDAFGYFTRGYLAEPNEADWTKRFAAPEGLAPEGQLNPKDIRKIIDYLGVKDVAVIFPESNVSRDSLRKIASAGTEMGLKVLICSEPLYGDAMGSFGYLEMMEKNGDTIARHLCNPQ